MNENYVINLGRQLGSGGKEIGEKLAKEFGIAFYDKELIKLASDESGLCKEFFEKADERASQSIIGGLFGTRFPFISDRRYPDRSCSGIGTSWSCEKRQKNHSFHDRGYLC